MPKIGTNGEKVSRASAPATNGQVKINDIRCDGTVVDLAKLKPDPMNARLHPERNLESIKESLTLYGQRLPLVVRQQNMVIAVGNGRYEAMKELGWTKVACTIQPMTDAEFTGYALADNRTAELAKWDFEVVAKLDQLLAEQGQNDRPGWSNKEILTLRAGLDPLRRGRTDPDDIPTVNDVVSKVGDLWQLGSHRLLCGDSANPKHVLRLVGDLKGALIATDPPYGVEFGKVNYNPTAKTWGDIKGDNRQGLDLRNWLAKVLKIWMPFTHPDAVWYIWSASLSEGHRFYEAIEDSGLHVQSQVIWAKNVFALGQADYQWMHEPAWYAFRKGAKHRWYGGRDKTTVWSIKRDANASYLHPTQKPVELFVRPLQYHTQEGEICLEPFCGGGTQIIAAEQMGRRCLAMELDPKWVDVAVRRWEEFTGRKAQLIQGES